MKNKEIEELLNDIKSDVKYYSDDYDYKNTVALFNVGKIESLLSYIEQLEKRIYKARKMIFDNYGVLDKMNELEGKDKE